MARLVFGKWLEAPARDLDKVVDNEELLDSTCELIAAVELHHDVVKICVDGRDIRETRHPLADTSRRSSSRCGGG